MTEIAGFTKKEFLEAVRTGKLLLILLLFSLFGIMAPAAAKLTPWLMDAMSEGLEETGMIVVMEIKVNALTSWAQFYKNVPMAFLVFFLTFSSILTAEYQKRTLVPMVIRMHRWKILLAKVCLLLVLWTAGYWICYGITYGYNAYFWDNEISPHVVFPAFCCYLLGIWTISLLLLMSVCFRSNSAVIIAVFGIFFVVYLLGLLPGRMEGILLLKKCLPVKLLASSDLLTGTTEPKEYVSAVLTTVVLTVFHGILAVTCFQKRRITD